MRSATNFIFANPFYADEVRVYPIRFYGDKVFRIELYGCYLGELLIIAFMIIAILINLTISAYQRECKHQKPLPSFAFAVAQSVIHEAVESK